MSKHTQIMCRAFLALLIMAGMGCAAHTKKKARVWIYPDCGTITFSRCEVKDGRITRCEELKMKSKCSKVEVEK